MKKIPITINLIWISLVNIIFWGSVSLGQLVRIQIANITFYPHDLIVILLCLRWFLVKVINKQLPQKLLKLQQLPFLLTVWILLGWLVAGAQNTLGLAAVLTAVRLTAYAIAATQLFSQTNTHFSSWYGKGIIFFTTFMMSSWGILQYVFIPDTRFLHIFGWDDHYFRLIGPLLDPNFAGLLAVIALWSWQNLKSTQIKQTALHRWHVAIDVVVTMVCLSALTMTFSRSSWLAFLASIIISLIFTRSKLRLQAMYRSLVWLVLVTVCYLILPKPTGEGVDITRTASVSARTSLSQQLISSLSGHEWLLGKGLFNVRPNIDSLTIAELERIPNTSRQPDNLIIQLVGSIGVGGICILLALLKKTNRIDWLTHQSAPLIAAWFIHAQFNNSLFQPQLWILFVSFVLAQNQEKLMTTSSGS